MLCLFIGFKECYAKEIWSTKNRAQIHSEVLLMISFTGKPITELFWIYPVWISLFIYCVVSIKNNISPYVKNKKWSIQSQATCQGGFVFKTCFCLFEVCSPNIKNIKTWNTNTIKKFILCCLKKKKIILKCDFCAVL